MSQRPASRQSRLTSAAFSKLTALHRAIGDTVSCGWPTYRREMSDFHGIDGATIDALARLGHFHITDTSVRFAA